MERSIYLKKTDWREARNLFRATFKDIFPLDAETIPVGEALHRITSDEVTAKLSSPAFDAAAMDGIAVQAEMTFGATSSKPVRLRIGKDCLLADTGAPIKKPFDAIIKIEDIVVADGMAMVAKGVPPGKDIRFAGEDFAAGERIVPEHHRVRPVDIGAMLSCGVLSVEVVRKPRVGIIPTGSEIVEPNETVEAGTIIDSNSFVAINLIREWGGEPRRAEIVCNKRGLLKEKIEQVAAENDVVIVIAGSSAGSEDLTLPVVKELGTVLVHGVDLMPGKPAILARIKDTPVIGLPGYPVSAFIILDIFVRDTVAMALGTDPEPRNTARALLAEGLPSKLGMDEIVRIKLRCRNGTLYAIPLHRGAGVLKSIVQADGFICIPKQEEGFNAGHPVTVELFDQYTRSYETGDD